MNYHQRETWQAPSSPLFGEQPSIDTLRMRGLLNDRRARLFGASAVAAIEFISHYRDSIENMQLLQMHRELAERQPQKTSASGGSKGIIDACFSEEVHGMEFWLNSR